MRDLLAEPGQGVTMRLKPPRTQVGFRRAPAAARGAKCAKRSSLVDPGSVVGERRLFDAESEDVSDGLGSGPVDHPGQQTAGDRSFTASQPHSLHRAEALRSVFS